MELSENTLLRKVIILLINIGVIFCFGFASQGVYASTFTQSMTLTSNTLTLDLTTGYYAQSAFLTPDYTMDIEIADFDNDGCNDAALAIFYNKQQKIFWGNCDGTWTEANQFGVRTGWGIDSADFNGDGYLDVVLGTYPGFGGPAGNYLFINNKDRTFTGSIMFGTGNTTNLHIQDINNDGRPDVIVPSASQCYTYTNNGDGTFTSNSLLTPVNTMNLRLFDINKDGHLDILKSEYSGGTRYHINNGDDTYTSYLVTGNVTSDMTPIDFNKDGNWDFTVAVQGQNYLYVNNGNGTWTQTNQFGTRNTNVHNVRDIDGNGYDDVISANGAWGNSQQNYVYYNNGNGTFTETAAFGSGSTYAMHFVDIDKDGDEDVVNGKWTANGNQIFYNGYYPTTSKTFSYPVALPSDFTGWEYLDVTETVSGGTTVQYYVFPEDTNNDNTCNDGASLLGPVTSVNNQVDISSVAGVPICVRVVLSSNRQYATPKVTKVNAIYAADSTSPTSPSLRSPSGYSKDATKPTLIFIKSVDSASGMSSYSVTLDSGKMVTYTSTGIPATGDSSKSNYIWKDDTSVKVEYKNENDSDSENDEIYVYFKGLNSNELAEGKHSWKVAAYDNSGNSREESATFYIDKTNPSISELVTLNETTRLPVFSGKAADEYYRGNNDYDKVSSGPKTLTLLIKKKNTDGGFVNHASKEIALSDVIDKEGNEKYATFSIEPPYPLVDGLYKVYLTLNDNAGNTFSYPEFDLPVNYVMPVESANTQLDSVTTEIVKKEEITAITEEEKQEIKEEGVVVQIKVLDKDGNPVADAKVELHSDPLIAYTDKNGIATFDNVPVGDHTVKIAYDNYEGEQKISLTKDNTKQFNFDIKVTEKVKSPLYVNPYFLVTMSVSFGLFGMGMFHALQLLKQKRKESKS